MSEHQDLVEQLMKELKEREEQGSSLDQEGSYEPIRHLSKEESDAQDDTLIQKLEEYLSTLAVGGEEAEEIRKIIAQLKKERAPKKASRVVERLYSVTRETEEKTGEVMDKIDEAMQKVSNIAEFIDQQKTEKAKEALGELEGILFDAISLLQFQDITRQKIERVIRALQSLNEYLNEWFGTTENSLSRGEPS
jgi:membrane-associated HD superfamily phosphohydrolase